MELSITVGYKKVVLLDTSFISEAYLCMYFTKFVHVLYKTVTTQYTQILNTNIVNNSGTVAILK